MIVQNDGILTRHYVVLQPRSPRLKSIDLHRNLRKFQYPTFKSTNTFAKLCDCYNGAAVQCEIILMTLMKILRRIVSWFMFCTTALTLYNMAYQVPEVEFEFL
jgi:hypothetical protein